MANINKKRKGNICEHDSEIEARTKFPSFISIKSLEETLLVNLSLYLIEKVITSRANTRTVKKWEDGNLHQQSQIRGQHTKTKRFHNLKCKAYLGKRRNNRNVVIRNRELSPAISEKINATLEREGGQELKKGKHKQRR